MARHEPEARAAALATYAAGASLALTATTHGIAQSTVHKWVIAAGISRQNGDAKRLASKQKHDAEYGLSGGRWVNVRGVQRWVVNPKPVPAAPLEPIACPCGARLSEPCRTTGGNWTTHADRVVSRRCPCGNVPRQGSHFCTEECRREARAATYKRREKRTPTRERRAA